MISRLVLVILSISFLLFSSCNVNQVDDGKKDGWIVGYYEDDTFKDSTYVIDGKIEGVQTIRDSLSGRRIVREYSAGLLNGFERGLYKNGDLYYEGNNYDDKKVRAWVSFYNDGAEKSYNYFDREGNLVFTRKQSQSGDIEFVSLYTFGYLAFEKQPICLTDSVAFNAFLPHPVGSYLKVIYAYDDSGELASGFEKVLSSDVCYGVLPPPRKNDLRLTILWEYFDVRTSEDTIKGRVLFDLDYNPNC